MSTKAPTAVEAIANELVEYCRSGRNLEALDRLYAPDIVSTEPMDFEGMPARMTGIDAIRRKNEWWYDNYETHRGDVDGPYVNGDQFAVKYTFDVTHRKSGRRNRNSEIAVYTVKNNKIAEERFYGREPENMS